MELDENGSIIYQLVLYSIRLRADQNFDQGETSDIVLSEISTLQL